MPNYEQLARDLVPYLAPYFLKYDSAYESGTYSPVYSGETTTGTTTYAVQVGSYTRIGRMAFAQGYVSWTAATGTGNALVSLPYTADSTANMFAPCGLYVDGITFATGSPMALVIPGTNHLRLYYPANNAGTTVIPVEAVGQVAFMVAYITA